MHGPDITSRVQQSPGIRPGLFFARDWPLPAITTVDSGGDFAGTKTEAHLAFISDNPEFVDEELLDI
jgi:hypothetical protein